MGPATPKRPAHPRACGENTGTSGRPSSPYGSSPRVRGKLRSRRLHDLRHGLIPARAGKTGAGSVVCASRRAHPRACGENTPEYVAAKKKEGSSPRVRGKRDLDESLREDLGLIPARAGKTASAASTSTRPRAHPRACGENPKSLATRTTLHGSSPRVRGKRSLLWGSWACGRLIPARAGKTRPRTTSESSTGAHPRACGENSSPKGQSRRTLGSSPRVRGKRLDQTVGHQRPRLIPARAGKTLGGPGGGAADAAHPRACGENPSRVCTWSASRGSSPRVRGKPDAWVFTHCSQRLIPARAGKTSPMRWGPAPQTAHPRACGENPNPTGSTWYPPGSSPRVRGKPRDVDRAPQAARLIPARAGKTDHIILVVDTHWAHPRACGENTPFEALTLSSHGSSPRVRGKPLVGDDVRDRGRLIPARAGKTQWVSPARSAPAAHPRACGENQVPVEIPLEKDGSSPRVRGKRRADDDAGDDAGLIPARAGKTSTHTFPWNSSAAHPRACGENPSAR